MEWHYLNDLKITKPDYELCHKVCVCVYVTYIFSDGYKNKVNLFILNPAEATAISVVFSSTFVHVTEISEMRYILGIYLSLIHI